MIWGLEGFLQRCGTGAMFEYLGCVFFYHHRSCFLLFLLLFSDQCFWSHRLLFCTSYSLRASYQIKFFNFIFFFPSSTSIPALARQPKSSISRPAARDDKRRRRKRERERDGCLTFHHPSSLQLSLYLLLFLLLLIFPSFFFFFYLIYIHMCSFSHFLNVEELWKEISLS